MTRAFQFARLALLLSTLLAAYFALAVFGPKFGLLDWRVGFGTMVREWGVPLIAMCAAVALGALAWCLFSKPRKGWARALFALAIPAAIMAGLLDTQQKAAAVPPIYDVATDMADPPEFSPETLALRERLEANPMIDFTSPLRSQEKWAEMEDLGDATAAGLIAEAFPQVRTVRLGIGTDAAVDAVAAAMEGEGLFDLRIDREEGRVEAVAETLAFGFRDDMVARVRPAQGGGSLVDLRSTSRVGLSDLGYNADRIVDVIAALED